MHTYSKYRTYIHTYIPTYIHTYIHTVHTYIHTTTCNAIQEMGIDWQLRVAKPKLNIFSSMVPHTYIYTYTYIHSEVHTCIHTYIFQFQSTVTPMDFNRLKYSHIHTHVYIHTYIHR